MLKEISRFGDDLRLVTPDTNGLVFSFSFGERGACGYGKTWSLTSKLIWNLKGRKKIMG